MITLLRFLIRSMTFLKMRRDGIATTISHVGSAGHETMGSLERIKCLLYRLTGISWLTIRSGPSNAAPGDSMTNFIHGWLSFWISFILKAWMKVWKFPLRRYFERTSIGKSIAMTSLLSGSTTVAIFRSFGFSPKSAYSIYLSFTSFQ